VHEVREALKRLARRLRGERNGYEIADEVLDLLSDGRVHSSEEISQAVGVEAERLEKILRIMEEVGSVERACKPSEKLLRVLKEARLLETGWKLTEFGKAMLEWPMEE